MITSVTLYKNASEFLELPMEWGHDLFLKSIDGLGKKNIVSLMDNPGIPGDTFRNIMSDFRAIDLEVGYGDSFNAIQARRDELLKFIRPHKEVTIRFTSDSLEPVEITGVVETFENEPFSKDPSVKATIVCSNPYFQSISEKSGPTINANGTYQFQNDGHISVGFRAEGTFSLNGDFKITRSGVATEYFEILNVNPATPFYWSTVPGDRYIGERNDAYKHMYVYQLYHFVNRLSTWLILKPGLNEFVVSNLAAGTSISSIKWFDRYEGI